ncbi:MAG: tetratricopeptide repeat protein [Bdellovibrionales bacterium]|nr:tetratricopeptide repeat protein [Bdellovibrionales bacterium]
MAFFAAAGAAAAAISARAETPSSVDASLLPKLELKSFESHSRMSIPVDRGVAAELKVGPKGFDLLLKDITFLDLGVPFGGERAFLDAVGQVGDARTGGITASEERGGVRISGSWKYATGEQAPADPGMMTFDFRTETPPAYVLDFWPKKGPTVAEARKEQARLRQLEALQKAQATAERRSKRRIASLKRQSDVADAGKYCKEPLTDSRDVFVEFRPAREEIDFTRWFQVTTADTEYPYFEPKGEGEDGQFLRLALDLYRSGKLALAVRTAEFFEKEHVSSPLKDEMKFLRANALLKLGYGPEAERLLRELVVDSAGSPAALHAGIYLAIQAFRNKDALRALESFLWLDQRYPNHRLHWVFRLGAAEAMYWLRETDKASKAYQWVVENAPDRASQAEAGLRIGDLFMERRQYAQALAAYYKALKYYGDLATKVPTSLVNRAEALYWLGQYDRAEKSFQEFRDAHAGHPAAWRAVFRLAEIQARKSGESFSGEARKLFYETVNRYPFSPGATLARLRLLPCGDHGGFGLAKAASFLEGEASAFDGGEEVFMDRYPDLLSLAHVRTLVSLDQEERAIEAVTTRMSSASDERTREVLVATARIALRALVNRLMDAGKSYEAVVFFRKYDWVVPEQGDPSLFDFMLRLSRDAADLGLGAFAESVAARYARLSPVSQPMGGRLPAAEEPEDIEDRMKRAEESYSRAKALWVEKGVGAAADVRQLLDRVTDESPFSAEKQVLLGLLDERAKEPGGALGRASKAELLLPPAEQTAHLRLRYWMARLNVAQGETEAAARLYSELQKSMLAGAPQAGPADRRWDSLGLPPLPSAEALVVEHALFHEAAGRWAEAAAAYGSGADADVGGNRVLFGYARALLKAGAPEGRKTAQGVLKKIAGSKEDDFWKKMASQSDPGSEESVDFQ